MDLKTIRPTWNNSSQDNKFTELNRQKINKYTEVFWIYRDYLPIAIHLTYQTMWFSELSFLILSDSYHTSEVLWVTSFNTQRDLVSPWNFLDCIVTGRQLTKLKPLDLTIIWFWICFSNNVLLDLSTLQDKRIFIPSWLRNNSVTVIWNGHKILTILSRLRNT